MGRRREMLRPGAIDISDTVLTPVAVPAVEDAVRSGVEGRVKAQLGLQGDLPEDVTLAIDTATKAAAAKAVQLSVAQAVEDTARDITRGARFDLFDDKIKVAADSIAHISQSGDVDQVLQQRAQLLSKKKHALVTAGFTEEQAMDILLADIAARQH